MIPHDVRSQFPILAERTYLASHSLGAVPAATEHSLRKYFNEWATEGILAWDGPWWNIISDFGDQVSTIIGAARDTVVPMENVTRGMAAVASSIEFTRERNQVVMTDLEFLTSYPFWEGVVSQNRHVGAELVIVRSDDGIHVPAEKICAAITQRTLIVPTSHVYFRSGGLQDLGAVTRAAHQHGALVLGDGYQAAGIVPMNVSDMGIDFYVGGSHKWLCGGPGAGFLYVRPDLILKLQPRFTGWFGIHEPFKYEPATKFTPAEGIKRFLGGTPNVPGLYAAIEGVRLVASIGMKAIREHSNGLTEHVIDEADRRKLNVRSPRKIEERSGMICLDFNGSEAATRSLLARNVIVDWRPNCGIRVSPHFYNDKADIDRLFAVLDEVRI